MAAVTAAVINRNLRVFVIIMTKNQANIPRVLQNLEITKEDFCKSARLGVNEDHFERDKLYIKIQREIANLPIFTIIQLLFLQRS